MIIAGAVLYHNFTLDKSGLEKLKNDSVNFVNSGIDKIKEGGTNIVNSASEKMASMQENADNETHNPQNQKPAKKPLNFNKTQETLALIEKLSEMKKSGILTDEEFSAKKQQLLEEI